MRPVDLFLNVVRYVFIIWTTFVLYILTKNTSTKLLKSTDVTEIRLYRRADEAYWRFFFFGYRSIDLDKLNNCVVHIISKYSQIKKFCHWLISTKKSTLQACHEIRGPISWYQSIGFDKVSNFCSTCQYKIFTSKKLLLSTYIDKKSTLHASHKTRKSIFIIYSTCVYKIFTGKKLLKYRLISRKFVSPGELLGRRAYFLISFDRSWLIGQLFFYMS